MLENIKNILQEIGDFFGSVAGFIVDFIEDIIYIGKLLTNAITEIPNYLTVFPAAIITALTVVLGIVIIYKIVGRT